MTSKFIAIKDRIKQGLEGIEGLKYVYGHEQGDLAGYPSVTIYSARSKPQYATTDQNMHAHEFEVHLYQELGGAKTPEQAEAIVDALIEKIMSAFEADYTLGGLVAKLEISVEKGWTDRELVDRAAVFTLSASYLAAL